MLKGTQTLWVYREIRFVCLNFIVCMKLATASRSTKTSDVVERVVRYFTYFCLGIIRNIHSLELSEVGGELINSLLYCDGTNRHHGRLLYFSTTDEISRCRLSRYR